MLTFVYHSNVRWTVETISLLAVLHFLFSSLVCLI